MILYNEDVLTTKTENEQN